MWHRGIFVLGWVLLMGISFGLQRCDCGGVGRDGEGVLADGQGGVDRSSTGGTEAPNDATQAEPSTGAETTSSQETNNTEPTSSPDTNIPDASNPDPIVGPELPQPENRLPAQPWFLTAGSNRNDFGMTITTRPDGGVYIGGSFETNASFGTFNTQNKHLTVAAVDHRGSVERVITMTAVGDDSRLGMRAVLADANDNLYVLALFRGSIALSNTLTMVGAGKSQLLLAKYDAKGALLWRSVAMNTAGWIESDSMLQGPGGDIYLAGHCQESLNWEGMELTPRGLKTNRLFVVRIQANSGKPTWFKGNAVGAIGGEVRMAPKIVNLGNALYVLVGTQLQASPMLPAWIQGSSFAPPGTHLLVLDDKGALQRIQSLASSEGMEPVDMVADAASQKIYISADAPGPVTIKGQAYPQSKALQRTFVWEVQEKGATQTASLGWVQRVEGLTRSLYESRSLSLALRKGGGLYAVGSFPRGTLELGLTLKLKTDRSVASVIAVVTAQGTWSKAFAIEGNTVEVRDISVGGDYLFVVGRYARSLEWQGVNYPSRGDYDVFALGLIY